MIYQSRQRVLELVYMWIRELQPSILLLNVCWETLHISYSAARRFDAKVLPNVKTGVWRRSAALCRVSLQLVHVPIVQTFSRRCLDVNNLGGETITKGYADARNSVAHRYHGKLTRCLYRVPVKKAVEECTSEEVSGTGSVYSLHVARGHKVALAVVGYVGSFRAHSDDDSLVLRLFTISKFLKHREQLFRFLETVQLTELFEVACQINRFFRSRLQMISVAAHAGAVGEEGNNTLSTAESSVDHFVGQFNLIVVSEHETVDSVVIEVIHNRLVQVIGFHGVGGTEHQVHGALGVGGNQRVQLAGEQFTFTNDQILDATVR
ncbi:5-methyltetrahydrofolate--homocysteine methyltransferase, putative [Babesia caballi]|uniref:5-methyltetrahydrofolate--homocysteine methyltransferase, putative n=1 Tax=Babesia caballi TaxID=5871 RepID=A0AAV4M2C3_BABCB|nr:5-methyltetrahydrofolate--homocysteine methyltransferase, putative [Babesia caballi]